MNKSLILTKTYQDLNVDFKINDKDHLHILPLWRDEFGNYANYETTRGHLNYGYSDLYEVMLWYRYYTIRHHHIEKKATPYPYKSKGKFWMNKGYFSRIPLHYRNIDPKIGLSIIKEVMDMIILRHKGIPSYYDEEEMNKICYIEKH